MTETTPTLLAARDALAAVLHDVRDGDEHAPWTAEPCRYCDRLADALLASGVVRDVTTLAADETLVEAKRQAWAEGEQAGREHAVKVLTFGPSERPVNPYRAALGGDRPAPTTEDQS